MIHIKDDKRSKHSAEALANGLIECLKEKEFSDITISDLQKASGISRATFYRLFDNTQDLLAYQCFLLASQLEKRHDATNLMSIRDFFITIISYWLDNYIFIDAIFKSGRADILIDALLKMSGPHSIPVGENDNGISPDENSMAVMKEYVLTALVGSMTSILYIWNKNGRKETPEELFNIFSQFGSYMSSMNSSKQ